MKYNRLIKIDKPKKVETRFEPERALAIPLPIGMERQQQTTRVNEKAFGDNDSKRVGDNPPRASILLAARQQDLQPPRQSATIGKEHKQR